MREDEIKYLKSLLIELKNEVGETDIPYSEGKIILGVSGDSPLNEYFSSKTMIDTVLNLDEKICYSLNKAIKFSYSKNLNRNFDMMRKGSESEFLAYYFIENVMYRSSTIWDCIAQLYNTHYKIGSDKENIYYKTFFNNIGQSKKFKNNSIVTEINDYLKEVDNTDISGRWMGNHDYVKRYRNKLTHQNSPEVLSMSNFDLNMKDHPKFILKRLMEDYNKGLYFFVDIVNKVKYEL